MLPIDANTPPEPSVAEFADPNARPDPQLTWTGEPDPVSVESPATAWPADIALKVVLADFHRAASFRASQIEPKWVEAHETYVAATGGTKFWEGSSVPRANLQVHQAFQQVNALRPQIVDAICGQDLDFDVEAARAGTTIGQCHLVRSLMQYLNRELGGMVRFQSWRYCVDRLVEDGLVLANGVQEFGWDGPRDQMVPRWQQQTLPEMMQVAHPITGQPVPMPTGRTVLHQTQALVPERVSRFFLDPCDLTDFYIDPDTRGANVQLARFCLRRRMMTVADLALLRGQPGWDIPTDATLLELSRKRWTTEGDTTRQEMASQAGVDTAGAEQATVDPRLRQVELLRYWQRDRHVWVIARTHVAWNQPNYLGCLPFLNWCYVNKPGQFYGFSIPELLRTDQRYIKTLLDARADELNLIIHPPMVAKAGTFRTASQAKLVPGRVIETTGDPTKDLLRMDMGNVTQNAYVETQAAENRGQQKTGVTDLALLGTPSSGGNSANRTATGVTAQTTASNSRVHGSVATIEDMFAGPMLQQQWELARRYLTPEDIARILGPDALQKLQLSPVDVLNSDPQFKLKTASKMKFRAAMQNGGLSTIMQYSLNGEVLSMFADQQGKTLDIEALSTIVCDTFSLPPYLLFRAMTPQEMQAKQERDQAAGQEKQQLQAARLQEMGAQARERDETALIQTVFQVLGAAGLLPKAVGLPSTVELEMRKVDQGLEAGGGA